MTSEEEIIECFKVHVWVLLFHVSKNINTTLKQLSSIDNNTFNQWTKGPVNADLTIGLVYAQSVILTLL